MERNPQRQPETFCKSCKKFIKTQNFLIHQGRCQRQQQLRSSRISSQSQSSSKKSQHWQNNQEQPSINYRQRNFAKQEKKRIFDSNSKRRQKQKPNIEEQQKIPCYFCGYLQSMEQLDTHPNTCQHWQIQCQFCQSKFPKSLMSQHTVMCSQNPDNMARRQQIQQIRQRDFQQSRFHLPFRSQQRQMYRPSPLMDMLFGRHIGHQHQQDEQEPVQSEHIFNIIQNGQNGPQRIIIRSNSSNPANFVRLIQMLAGMHNHNQSPGLNQEQLKNLKRVKYIQDKPQADTCTICFCEFEQSEQLIELNCKHKYHQECIFQWLKRVSTCPNCKKHIKQENSHGRQRQDFQRGPNRQPNRGIFGRGGFF